MAIAIDPGALVEVWRLFRVAAMRICSVLRCRDDKRQCQEEKHQYILKFHAKFARVGTACKERYQTMTSTGNERERRVRWGAKRN